MPTPPDIDDYIAPFPPPVQEILQQIRRLVQEEVPEAREAISYQMPTFKLGQGKAERDLVNFAAFKHHIGIFPPVRGDAALLADLAPYLGEKGNLRFPLDAPMPWELLRRAVRQRRQELQAGPR